jgi:uncharacterized protein involved in exopolysaccharide biosynthesis
MQSLPGVSGQETSSIRPFVESAFRHRWLWLIVVVIVIAMTLAYALLTPRQYQSEMNLLVQNARGNYLITPERTTGTVMVNEVTEEQINSEIEVLRSRSLANVVVDPTWNEQSAHTLTPEQLKAHDKAVEQYNKHLTINLVRKSNVIQVTYTAGDPHTANLMLNRLLDAFLSKHKEIGHPAGTSQFFATEAARYKKELDDAQQQLASYQQQQQIVSLPDTEQTIDHQITDAQNELRSTDAQISEVSDRLTTQTHQLRSVPTRQSTQERTIPNDYSVERLNTMLAELQNKRSSLLTKFTPQDRLVQEVDEQIANTKTALKNAQQMTSQERSSDVNPVWEQVTASIVQNQAERQALKARRGELAEQVKQLQSNLSNVEGSTVAFTTLRQKVTELENNYQLYAQKRDEAQMAYAMDADKLLNVAVAQTPTFSITPFRPKPVVDLLLGSFTAIFLASFMVFFAEMGRATIATPRELDMLSRHPLLATVPLEQHHGENSERRPKSERLSITLTPDTPVDMKRMSAAFEKLRKETQAS